MPELPAATSASAPQLRDAQSVKGMMRTVLVALLPCALFGLWNSGRQAIAGLAALEGAEQVGWRAEWMGRLGPETLDGGLAPWLVGGLYFLPLLLVSSAAAVGWEQLFARWRGKPAGEGAFVTAVIFTLLLPPATPPWQAALGVSFGLVLGKLVFGGIGRNFLNPAVTGLAFLAVAWPERMPGAALFPGLAGHAGTEAFARAAAGGAASLGESGPSWLAAFLGLEPARIGESSALACLLGAAWLLHRRVASWRVMAGVLLGALAAAAAWNLPARAAGEAFLPAPAHLVLGGLAFVAVFVATDPVSASATRAGRWLVGLLIGALAVVLRVAHPEHPDGVVQAVLLANVATPLIDHAVVRLALRRGTRRSMMSHG